MCWETWKMLSSSKKTPLLLILFSFPTHSVWNQYKAYLNDCSGTPPPDPVWTPQKKIPWQKHFSGHLSQPQQGWLYFASSISLIYIFLLPISFHLSFNPPPKKKKYNSRRFLLSEQGIFSGCWFISLAAILQNHCRNHCKNPRTRCFDILCIPGTLITFKKLIN